MEKLKTYLLQKLPFINMGVSGVILDNLTGKLISYDGQEVGISDKNGSYFYIRERGDQSFRIIQNNAPKIVSVTQDYRLVIYSDLNISEVKKCTLNSIFNYPELMVMACSTNSGQIIQTEYPKTKSAELLKKIEFRSLVAIDFRMTEQMIINNCECRLCRDCATKI